MAAVSATPKEMKTLALSPDDQSMGEIELCSTEDPVQVAKEAGLRYVTDASPGIRRKRVGKHFSYPGLDGKPIRNPKELERIKKLGIPPAWQQVWISPDPRGHIQATGRDAKGRKQYRYHARWREVRDETKYEHIITFGEHLPRIRERVQADLSRRDLSYEKILATIVRLLDTTLIRVGNEEYARANDSYGLTTMRTQHVEVEGARIRFHFRGKSGKQHEIDVKDRALARVVKRCLDLPGQELFQYVETNGETRTVESSDVNDYLQEISGKHFTAKDFRTWGGTVIAMDTLRELGPFESQTGAKHNVAQAIKTAAEHLGNTPTICRKCYVHPGILAAYMDGSLLAYLGEHPRQSGQAEGELRSDEAQALGFLQHLAGENSSD